MHMINILYKTIEFGRESAINNIENINLIEYSNIKYKELKI